MANGAATVMGVMSKHITDCSAPAHTDGAIGRLYCCLQRRPAALRQPAGPARLLGCWACAQLMVFCYARDSCRWVLRAKTHGVVVGGRSSHTQMPRALAPGKRRESAPGQ